MRSFGAFVDRHPVGTYFVLTFIVSWGGFLIVGARGLLSGSDWQVDPRFMWALLAMLAGPPVASVVSTVLVDGASGLRKLFGRLGRWRVDARWYAVALLTTPLAMGLVLVPLSLASPEFLPAIATQTGGAAALLGTGLVVGLAGGFVEELGWTGFAIPRLRLHHGVFATGLTVGAVWAAWHGLQMGWVGGSFSGAVAPALFMPLFMLASLAQLSGYRVLMVWVHEHTDSLPLAIVMHASYIACTLFVLAPPAAQGPAFLTYAWGFAASLWLIVAAVAVARRGALARPTGRATVA